MLAADSTNPDAEESAGGAVDHGELRRLTIMFADLVDSTALSTRIEPENYRTIVGRYRDEVVRAVNAYGATSRTPRATGCWRCSGTRRRTRTTYARRPGGPGTSPVPSRNPAPGSSNSSTSRSLSASVHRGLVYLDTAQDDVYGFAANLAALHAVSPHWGPSPSPMPSPC